MKICIAQTISKKGKIQENIQNHLQMINRAIKSKVDLIIFPELSITNYEPELAKELSFDIEDERFHPFQQLADNNGVVIGIGLPTKTNKGINISMLIFQANKKSVVYSKQLLHADELPYFVPGKKHLILDIKGNKVAFGICYEALQREHFLNAHQKGTNIYIASVAKPKNGIEKAYKHFPEIAREFNTPILMSNCIGDCDNFKSVGQSAVWNQNGVLTGQLDQEHQGMLIYNTQTELVTIDQTTIVKGQLEDLEELFQIYLNGKNELEKSAIYQWTDTYPTRAIIESDLRKGVLYTLRINKEIIGAIQLSEEQEDAYKLVKWEFNDAKILVIHRLVIDPKFQRKGYAKKLMDFAESFALKNNYSSIRLDAYSKNNRVIDFYKKRAYFIRGDVYFPDRAYSFHCMEKEMSTTFR